MIEDEISTITRRRLSGQFEMKALGIPREFLSMESSMVTTIRSKSITNNMYIQQLFDRHGMWECNPVATPLGASVKLSSVTGEEVPVDPQENARIVGEIILLKAFYI